MKVDRDHATYQELVNQHEEVASKYLNQVDNAEEKLDLLEMAANPPPPAPLQATYEQTLQAKKNLVIGSKDTIEAHCGRMLTSLNNLAQTTRWVRRRSRTPNKT